MLFGHSTHSIVSLCNIQVEHGLYSDCQIAYVNCRHTLRGALELELLNRYIDHSGTIFRGCIRYLRPELLVRNIIGPLRDIWSPTLYYSFYSLFITSYSYKDVTGYGVFTAATYGTRCPAHEYGTTPKVDVYTCIHIYYMRLEYF